ncbi:hypothetical protein DFH08DRAFT_824910 [Mycena albidolilacea]|uniref:Uncharacterized protein n=1 Tax=Mycena albidolilacea TaxID=1033008 RepID=A0AAD6Z410_9AGAR|nr:hypothetical protein DFH08DRAFT_824910 [Mycena albidolilacea]
MAVPGGRGVACATYTRPSHCLSLQTSPIGLAKWLAPLFEFGWAGLGGSLWLGVAWARLTPNDPFDFNWPGKYPTIPLSFAEVFNIQLPGQKGFYSHAFAYLIWRTMPPPV